MLQNYEKTKIMDEIIYHEKEVDKNFETHSQGLQSLIQEIQNILKSVGLTKEEPEPPNFIYEDFSPDQINEKFDN